MSYADVVNALNPVAYWRLGESDTSGTAVDTTGNYDGTYINNPTSVAGLVVGDADTAINFNGVDQYIQCPASLDLTDGAGNDSLLSFTFNIKINSIGLDIGGILSKWDSTVVDTSETYISINTDGELVFQLLTLNADNRIYITSNTALSTGVNYNITVTYDGTYLVSGMKIYVNGILQSVTETINGTYSGITHGLSTFDIASTLRTSDTYHRFFDGVIDDVSIFKQELTQQQVTELYNTSINPYTAFDITIDHTKVDEDLYDFPLLVNLGTTSGIDAFNTSAIFAEINDTLPANLQVIKAIYKNPADYVPPVSVDDDFTGNDGDIPNTELWKGPFYSDSVVDSASTTIQTNKLEFNCTFKNGVSGNVTLNSEFMFEGDFDVQIDATQVVSVEDFLFRFYLAGVPDTNINLYVSGSTRYVHSYLNGVSGGTVTRSNDTISLRIERVGTTVTLYYSTTVGGEWLVKGTTTMTVVPVYLQLNLYAIGTTSQVNTTPSFDNFIVNSGTITWSEPLDSTVKSQKCKTEIDRWDQVNNQAQLWIKVPYISKDVDTAINLSYDSTNTDNSENIGYVGDTPSKDVWSGYDAVYHLSADGKDSAGSTLDGILVNIDGTNVVDFGIGKGLSFNGVDEHINLTANNLTRDYTITLQIEIPNVIGQKTLIDGVNGGWTINGDKISYNNTSDGTTVLAPTTHYEIVLQDNTGTGTTFINGISADSISPNALDLIIDTIATETSTPTNYFSSKLKEIRFAKNLKSAPYIATNYDSTQDDLTRYALADAFVLNRIITGTITETLAVTEWFIRSYNLSDGVLSASLTSGNGTFTLEIPVGYWQPQTVTITPNQGSEWVTNVVTALDTLIFPTDVIATPYYYKCTVAGTTSGTEPTWPTGAGNTVVDNDVTWTLVERMIQPITQSPLIPIQV